MKKNRLVNPSEITQNTYSDKSSAQRNIDVGLSAKPIGLINNTKKRIAREIPQSFVAVVFYNQTSSAVFVKFGDKDVTAPTSAADGFPVLPGEKCTLNSGANEFAITSSATGIYAYSAIEEEG